MTTSTITPRDLPTSRVLARTCFAEWARLWTVRATWWFLAAAAVTMVGIGTMAGLDSASDPAQGGNDTAWLAAAITAMPAQFALLGLVLLAVTSDYATGGIAPTLQWTPRRSVLFAARTAVPVATATVLGVLLGAAATLAAWLGDPRLLLVTTEAWTILGNVALVLAAGTSLAVGLGFLLRSTAGGLVSVFLLMLVLPLLLPQFGYRWMMELAELLPGSGAAYLLLGEVGGMTTTSSITVMVAWAAGALLLGAVRFLRTDADH